MLPTYFISHGGGPWPWIKDQMPTDMRPLEQSLQRIPRDLQTPPTAILAISGHWEERVPTVMTSAHPPMLYDYGGFPEFTYHIQYPAPGSPEVAARVQQLLADFDVHADAHRGFDHGVFAPFYAMYPEANVPILQLSLAASYDPALHLAIGRALKPLRDENVLIVGSGLSYHNLRLMGPRAQEPSRLFDTWLTDAVTAHTGGERSRLLEAWSEAPAARVCHPQEDHLIPLMVAAGAAEDDNAERIYHEDAFFGGVHASSYRFGAKSA